MNVQDIENAIAKLKQSLTSCITIYLAINDKGQQFATASVRDNRIVPVYFTRISPDHSSYIKKLKVYSQDYVISCGKNAVVECSSWFFNKSNVLDSIDTTKAKKELIQYLEGLRTEMLREKRITNINDIKHRSEVLIGELGG